MTSAESPRGTRKSGARPALTSKNSAKARAARHRAVRAESAPDLGPTTQGANRIPVGLSSSAVYPLSISECFAVAADLGYDGVEVMVSSNSISQDPKAIRNLCEHYGLPVLSIHAPTLLVMQRVWGKDPWTKIERSSELAAEVGADTVVVHPPFRWQGSYAEGFHEGVRRISKDYGINVAVENMFPWRTGVREVMVYLPDWNPVDEDYDKITVDFSHAATAGSDILGMIDTLGDRLAHIHLADGSGSLKDEHLAPGHGNQPCAEALQKLSHSDWTGAVVAEVNTRRCRTIAERDDLLLHTLSFAREHLGQLSHD
ncbi:sugar phosphate isomerase/epimerase [Saxibacter everestensis]|uniref:Sugar phosphate isomerase/epimerase n=1 Tax=Saxibacter everestensis TaxID=2909229 RepID=A0ABY8QPW2_9MICO|nr:sugar phosphate isomerase/epimerase [Brevibacteriaceae bacterium ZFBP1038]